MEKQGPSQDCVDISNPEQVTHLLQRQKVGLVRHLSAVTWWTLSGFFSIGINEVKITLTTWTQTQSWKVKTPHQANFDLKLVDDKNKMKG